MNTNYDIHDQEMDSVITETNEALTEDLRWEEIKTQQLPCSTSGIHIFLPNAICNDFDCFNKGVK